MKKYILVIIFSIFFITGCDAEYTLNIDNDYEEIIKFSSNDQEEISMLNSYNFAHPAFYNADAYSETGERLEGVEYYNYSHNNGLTANYKFGNLYKNSRAFNYCFPNIEYSKGKTILIRTTTDNRCFKYNPNLDTLTINIVTNKEVVDNNADKVVGNKYTWIYKQDGGLKSITFEVKNPDYKGSSKNEDDDNKKEKKDIPTPAYVYLLLSLFFGSIFAIIMFRNKKRK